MTAAEGPIITTLQDIRAQEPGSQQIEEHSLTQRTYKQLLVHSDRSILQVRLNRPQVHNALNPEMIAELTECFSAVQADDGIRAVMLSGEGASFCAGADLNYMQTVAQYSREENVRDATALFDMLTAINGCPVPTLAQVQGAALGGGGGLIACCDVVVASEDTRFGFTEAKLGILPAVISPFVIAKIGESHARALITTAERFDAHRALLIGLAHHVVPAQTLQSAVEREVRELISSAPGAAAEAKTLVWTVKHGAGAEVRGHVAETIARLRSGTEGQEGISAFLEKRKPGWTQTEEQQ